MPVRYTAEVVTQAILGFIGNTEEEIKSHIYRHSVRPATLKSYQSEIKKLRWWLAIMNTALKNELGQWIVPNETLHMPAPSPLPLEEEFLEVGRSFTQPYFLTFIKGHIEVFNIQYRKMRAALRLAQCMAGMEVWAASPDIILAEKAAYHARQLLHPDRRVRGTMTDIMAIEFFKWVESKHPAAAIAMQIQFGAALRISELIKLKRYMVSKDGILIINAKRNRVGALTSAADKVETKKLTGWSEGNEALRMLLKLQSDTIGDHTLLFPRESFTIKIYNDLIKAAAEALSFPEWVRFDGSHVLRHAGVGAAVRSYIARGVSLETIAKTLLMSEGMVCHYALTNSERAARRTRPELLKKCTVQTEAVPDSANEDSDLEEMEVAESMQEPKTKGGALKRDRKNSTSPTQTVVATQSARELRYLKRQVK